MITPANISTWLDWAGSNSLSEEDYSSIVARDLITPAVRHTLGDNSIELGISAICHSSLANLMFFHLLLCILYCLFRLPRITNIII